MSEYYYDVPMTLDVVISVKGSDEQDAKDSLYAMDDEALIVLLAEQVQFVGMTDTDTLQ